MQEFLVVRHFPSRAALLSSSDESTELPLFGPSRQKVIVLKQEKAESQQIQNNDGK